MGHSSKCGQCGSKCSSGAPSIGQCVKGSSEGSKSPTCSKCSKKQCPVGPTGPTGPCCTGPTGQNGTPGISNFIASYFDALTQRIDLAFTGTPVFVASVAVGTPSSPPRIVEIMASFAGSSSVALSAIDFSLVIDGDQVQPGGSEVGFPIVGLGASGSLVRRVGLGAGQHIVSLAATATGVGTSIDPVTRAGKDNASLLVLETAA